MRLFGCGMHLATAGSLGESMSVWATRPRAARGFRDVQRFLTRDPVGMCGDSLGNGDGYSYAGGNPQNLTDPFGLWPTGMHEDSARAFVMTKTGNKELADKAAAADGWVDKDQDPANGERHATARPQQETADAISTIAGRFQSHVDAAANALVEGEAGSAMKEIGQAMHLAEDYTSSYHWDEQGPTGSSYGNGTCETCREGNFLRPFASR